MIKELKITDKIDIKRLKTLLNDQYEFLDISEAEMGMDEEYWERFLGYSHSGPVRGNWGYRKVEVLRRLLEQIDAKTILLPDSVMLRHINSAKKNPHIKELQVRPSCPSFAYEDGKLMNKKRTKPVFGCELYIIHGEIFGLFSDYKTYVEALLSEKEVSTIKEHAKEYSKEDLFSLTQDYLPKLYDRLDSLFHYDAWKTVTREGMDYGYSRAEAAEVDMSGISYKAFIPDELLTEKK